MYFFYDTETGGLDRDYSQILQIAFIATDDDFNILSKFKAQARLSPFSLPSPHALLVTGFSPEALTDAPMSYFDMMRATVKWVSENQIEPAVFTGYNTLGFDEGVLAQNLFQNLLDPGMTTANGNTRLDIMNYVRAAMLYAPGAIVLDEKSSNGFASLKLGVVARQNGVQLSEEDAHDALNDVVATVGLARVIRAATPDIWDHLNKLSTPAGVDAFLAEHKIFTTTSVMSRNVDAKVVTQVAEGLVYDLNVHPSKYTGLTPQQLVFVLNAKESPFRKIDKNAQPILMSLEKSQDVLPAEYDADIFEKRADIVRDPAFAARLAEAVKLNEKERTYVPELPERVIRNERSEELRERLNVWCRDFHNAAEWPERGDIIRDFHARFTNDLTQDPSLRTYPEMAGRILFENAPEQLTPEAITEVQTYIARRFFNPKAPYQNLVKSKGAMREIMEEAAAGKLDPEKVQLAAKLEKYYQSVDEHYRPLAGELAALADQAMEPKPPKEKKPRGGKPAGPEAPSA